MKKPYKKCRGCGTQVPKELFLYDGLTFLKSGKIFRHYRCRFCKASIYAEKVSEKEKMNGILDDPLYCGKKTAYGQQYS
jgi:hypothetical protein